LLKRQAEEAAAAAAAGERERLRIEEEERAAAAEAARLAEEAARVAAAEEAARKRKQQEEEAARLAAEQAEADRKAKERELQLQALEEAYTPSKLAGLGDAPQLGTPSPRSAADASYSSFSSEMENALNALELDIEHKDRAVPAPYHVYAFKFPAVLDRDIPQRRETGRPNPIQIPRRIH
jgi:hypothetical protein